MKALMITRRGCRRLQLVRAILIWNEAYTLTIMHASIHKNCLMLRTIDAAGPEQFDCSYTDAYHTA